MEKYDIYQTIAERTNGDIYVGVVGPVRTGKSTFIQKFMETLVIPNIADPHERQRALDEMPQSADGRTIMTTQPKFVPNQAVNVKLREHVEVKVRMLDCVGYLIEGAKGHLEGEQQRMVRTPWSDEELPFEKAAEIGTQKVIKDHSTIGILITSDGNVTDIERKSYIPAEERVVRELKEYNKPFVMLLNSKEPTSKHCENMRLSLEEKYEIPVVAVNVMELNLDQINGILERILFEFPLKKLDLKLPEWMRALPCDHPIMKALTDQLKSDGIQMAKMKDCEKFATQFSCEEYFSSPVMQQILLGEGRAVYQLEAKEGLFNSILSQVAGEDIADDYALMNFVQRLAKAGAEYDKLKQALAEVKENGYGVVTPSLDEMSLEEPQIVRQGSKFGVRLKASAPSLHIMRVDINTEVSPIVGTEQQSEELVKYLLSEFENDPKGIWETNMFGKSLHALVKEGLTNKLHAMPTDAQNKMRKTLSRIVNEGKGGMICILL